MGNLRNLLKDLADIIENLPDFDAETAEYEPNGLYVEDSFGEKVNEIKRFLALEPDERTRPLYGNSAGIAQPQYGKIPGPHAAYDEAFFECYEQYRSQMALMPAGRRANQLLDAYYQRDKIRDMLQGFIEHVNDIEPEDDAQLTARVGYNNHVRFLKLQLDEMLTQYDHYVGNAYADDPDPDAVRSRVCEFIRIECQMISCLRDLPKAWELIGREDVFRSKEKQSQIFAIYDLFNVRGDHIGEIQTLRKRLDEVTAKYRRTIEKADALRKELQDILTDEWFAALDPNEASNGISAMTSQELKEHCSRLLVPVEEKLLNVY